MDVIDRLMFTRKASWSDKKRAFKRIQEIAKDRGLETIDKLYRLGFAEESTAVVNDIISCISYNNLFGLKRIFNTIPYGHDELGLTPIVGVCSVYVVINGNEKFFAIVASQKFQGSQPRQKLLYWNDAKGFSYKFMCRKTLLHGD